MLEIVVQNQPKKICTSDDTTNEKKSTLELQIDGDDGHKEHGLEKAALISYNRAKYVVIDERKNSVRRLDYMKIELKVEENEFSKMSNEDRNKSVEEFIQKFNKQIRLQASTINDYQI